MEVTGNTGNIDTNENMDFHVVVLMNDDGSEEVFKFPKSPPQVPQPQPSTTTTMPPLAPIVIEDSSDTESEAEEEVLEKKKEEKKKEDKKEEEAEGKEEKDQAKEAKAEEKEEAKEEEQEENKKKRTRITAPLFQLEPTPIRTDRSTNHRSLSHSLLQPAPTTTPAPIPSELFPPAELPKVDMDLQIMTDVENVLATPAPMSIELTCPRSPLPELDLTFDIMQSLEK